MSDKRRCQRFPIEVPATFQLADSDENISFAATVDVSATGLSIITKEPLPKGQQIIINLQFPHHKIWVIHAEVMRVEAKDALMFLGGIMEFKVGIRIVEPIQGDEREYIRYIAEKIKEATKRDKT